MHRFKRCLEVETIGHNDGLVMESREVILVKVKRRYQELRILRKWMDDSAIH